MNNMPKNKYLEEEIEKERIRWQCLEIEEVYEKLSTSEKGLAKKEAESRLEKYGPNKIEYEEKHKILKMIGAQFKNFLLILLIIAFIISLFLGIQHTIKSDEISKELYEAIIIFVIIVLNVVIGFAQEYKSDHALETIKHYYESRVVVIREGREQIIPSLRLVPGDIVKIETGDRIPTDLRLIETTSLKIDEVPITGESASVTKKAITMNKEECQLPDLTNIAFMGSTVVYGRGIGVVISTGNDSEMGKMTVLTKTKQEKTYLQETIDKFAKSIAVFVLILVLFTMIYRMVSLITRYEKTFLDAFFESLEIAIVLAVSAVPEGIAVTIAIALTIGATRMAKRNAIITRLPAVETLGSVDYLCTGKTGTLTKGEMTVEEVWLYEKKHLKVSGTGYDLEGELSINGDKIEPRDNKQLEWLLKCAYLCNNASLIKNGKEIKTRGDPTEIALIVLAEKAGIAKSYHEERVREIVFESRRKRMTTIYRIDNEYYAFMKGAPSTVIDRCQTIMQNGKEILINKEIHDEVLQRKSEMSKKALRVLAMAYRKVPEEMIHEESDSIESEMVFIGLTGMIDPPRPEIRETITKCRKAGIKTVLFSGDQRDTCMEIAKEVGILTEESDLVLNGEEFSTLTDYELKEKIQRIKVYSRVDTKDKYRIVTTLQEMGHVVAVVGGGVNDSPALKKADIGIAMGSGTDQSIEAADMILKDDSFNTIVEAVGEGRTIFHNMKKFVHYALSSNIDEIFEVFIILSLFNMLPLLPLQILFLNLLTDSLPALSLASEPHDPSLMEGPPANRKHFLREIYGFSFLTGCIALIASLGDFLIGYLLIGEGRIEARMATLNYTIPTGYTMHDYVLAYAQLISFVATIVYELIFIFLIRCDDDTPFLESKPLKNTWLIKSVLLSFILLLVVVYVPPLQALFTSFPPGFYYVLGIIDWLLILSLTLVVNIIIEGTRYVSRKQKLPENNPKPDVI